MMCCKEVEKKQNYGTFMVSNVLFLISGFHFIMVYQNSFTFLNILNEFCIKGLLWLWYEILILSVFTVL